jgi:hypothetical protein
LQYSTIYLASQAVGSPRGSNSKIIMQISRRLLGLSRLCISARVVYPPAVSWALARMHKQHTCGRLKAPIGSLQSLAYLKSGAETSSYSCSRIQAQLHRARDARQRQQRHTCRVAEQPSLTHAYSSQAVSARQAANQQDSTPQRYVITFICLHGTSNGVAVEYVSSCNCPSRNAPTLALPAKTLLDFA